MKEKRFVYAINSTQIFYELLIVEETETEYVCIDNFLYDEIYFYIDKKTLNVRVEAPGWSWFNKDWFASLDKKEVESEMRRRDIENIKNVIKEQQSKLAELMQTDITLIENDNVIDFNTLNKGDVLYVLDSDNGRLHIANVVAFSTEDKVNFTPMISCVKIDAHRVEVERNDTNYYIYVQSGDDGWESEMYLVFKSNEAGEIYKKNKETEKRIHQINGVKRYISELNNKLQKLQNM